tara:strand:- start:1522 stop:1770 length:249 start_codon:yes stop_codon:yes gene_type:complete
MSTFYLYRGYDHGRTTKALAIVEGIQGATKAAKRLSKQLGVICVRDCLGGLRVEIKASGIETSIEDMVQACVDEYKNQYGEK